VTVNESLSITESSDRCPSPKDAARTDSKKICTNAVNPGH
jgi:hypothetical protein